MSPRTLFATCLLPPEAPVFPSLLLDLPWPFTVPVIDAARRFLPNDIMKPATMPRRQSAAARRRESNRLAWLRGGMAGFLLTEHSPSEITAPSLSITPCRRAVRTTPPSRACSTRTRIAPQIIARSARAGRAKRLRRARVEPTPKLRNMRNLKNRRRASAERPAAHHLRRLLCNARSMGRSYRATNQPSNTA